MIKRGIGFLILAFGILVVAANVLAWLADAYIVKTRQMPVVPVIFGCVVGIGFIWLGKRMAFPKGRRKAQALPALSGPQPLSVPSHLRKAVYAVLAKIGEEPLKVGAAEIEATFTETGLAEKYHLPAKTAVYGSILERADKENRQILGLGEWGRSIGMRDEDLAVAAENCWFAINRARKMLSDGVLSDDERQELEAIGRNLCASLEVRGWIDKAARAEVEAVAISQDRVDQEEMDRLGRILQVYRHAISPDTVHKIEEMHHMWTLESGPITPVAAPFPLQRGEVCAYIGSVNNLKRKTKTVTKGYSSAGVSIRVARGVYLRTGRSHPIRSTKEVIEQVDSGRLALTNKRIVFVGAKGSSTIQISKVVGIDPYSDAVAIAKGTGASPIYQFCDGTTGEFMILLSRFMSEVSA